MTISLDFPKTKQALLHNLFSLAKKLKLFCKLLLKDVLEDLAQVGQSQKFMFPIMALLAGGLGGVFGIGGGMPISPLLLQVGIAPEVN